MLCLQLKDESMLSSPRRIQKVFVSKTLSEENLCTTARILKIHGKYVTGSNNQVIWCSSNGQCGQLYGTFETCQLKVHMLGVTSFRFEKLYEELDCIYVEIINDERSHKLVIKKNNWWLWLLINFITLW